MIMIPTGTLLRFLATLATESHSNTCSGLFCTNPPETSPGMTAVNTSYERTSSQTSFFTYVEAKNMRYLRPEVVLPTVTLGMPACKKNISVIVHRSHLGGGSRFTATKLRRACEFQKNVDSLEDDDADEHHHCDCLLG